MVRAKEKGSLRGKTCRQAGFSPQIAKEETCLIDKTASRTKISYPRQPRAAQARRRHLDRRSASSV
jgi:hypothetical protein